MKLVVWLCNEIVCQEFRHRLPVSLAVAELSPERT